MSLADLTVKSHLIVDITVSRQGQFISEV